MGSAQENSRLRMCSRSIVSRRITVRPQKWKIRNGLLTTKTMFASTTSSRVHLFRPFGPRQQGAVTKLVEY